MKSITKKNTNLETHDLMDSISKGDSVYLLIKALMTPLGFLLFYIIEGVSDNVPLVAIGSFLLICPFLFLFREAFFNEKPLVSLYLDFYNRKLKPSNIS